MKSFRNIKIFYRGKEIKYIEEIHVTPDWFFIKYYDEEEQAEKTLRCSEENVQYQ